MRGQGQSTQVAAANVACGVNSSGKHGSPVVWKVSARCTCRPCCTRASAGFTGVRASPPAAAAALLEETAVPGGEAAAPAAAAPPAPLARPFAASAAAASDPMQVGELPAARRAALNAAGRPAAVGLALLPPALDGTAGLLLPGSPVTAAAAAAAAGAGLPATGGGSGSGVTGGAS